MQMRLPPGGTGSWNLSAAREGPAVPDQLSDPKCTPRARACQKADVFAGCLRGVPSAVKELSGS